MTNDSRRAPMVPALLLITAVLGFVVLLILMMTPAGYYGSATGDAAECPSLLNQIVVPEDCEGQLDRRANWAWFLSLPTLVAAVATVVRWPRRIHHPDGTVSWM